MKLMKPSIIKDAFDSPGCTRPVNTTIFLTEYSGKHSGSCSSKEILWQLISFIRDVTSNKGTSIPPRLLQSGEQSLK